MSTLSILEVRMLGGFSMTRDGSPVPGFRAGKARSLFQYLVLRRGQVVSRETLQEVLWPESTSGSPSSLKVAVHALRRVLGAADTGGVRIDWADVGYVLHGEGIRLDVAQFEDLVGRARTVDRAGDETAATSLYATAMEIYRGDLLCGDRQDWVVEHREWCRSLALRSLDRLRTAAVRDGDVERAEHWCRRTLELDPYCERAYQMVIDLHGGLGELGAARTWFELCEQRLREHLDIAPSPETEHAYQRAVRSATSGRALREVC